MPEQSQEAGVVAILQATIDTLHQMNKDILPQATFVVNSGTGLHLYYVCLLYTSLRLSPYPRENIFIIFPWPKGHRGAYIILSLIHI